MTIEYTTASYNPFVGCRRASVGCDHCYAAREAGTRLAHLPDYAGLVSTHYEADGTPRHVFNGQCTVRLAKLDEPFRTTKPQRYFVCSTSDFFYKDVGNEIRDKMLAVMALTPWHTYLILSKRPKYALEYLLDPKLYYRVMGWADVIRSERPGLGSVGISHLGSQPWIWWGVSAENQFAYDLRVPLLSLMPVQNRFVSFSPLLERINTGSRLEGIGWTILEGESGPNARPCDLDWLRGIIAECKARNVPVYLKQLGEHSTDTSEVNSHTGQPCEGEVHIGRRGHAGRDESCWGDLRGNKQLPVFWTPDPAVLARFPSMARKRKAK